MRALFQERSRNRIKSKLVYGDRERSLETSSEVTQVNEERLGGVKGGGT